MGERTQWQTTRERLSVFFLSPSLHKKLLHIAAHYMWEAGSCNVHILQTTFMGINQKSNTAIFVKLCNKYKKLCNKYKKILQNLGTIKNLSCNHSALSVCLIMTLHSWGYIYPLKKYSWGIWNVIYLFQLQLHIECEQVILEQFWVCYSLQITTRETQTVSSIKPKLKRHVSSRF